MIKSLHRVMHRVLRSILRPFGNLNLDCDIRVRDEAVQKTTSSTAAGSSVGGARQNSHSSIHPLRETISLFWSAADAYAKHRLLWAAALVGAGALLAALTPLALKLVIDAVSAPVDASYGVPLMLMLIYVCAQCFWRGSSELRTMFHGHADQRLQRRIGLRLFDHLIRLPMRFYLERKAGAVGESVEQGLRGAQMVLQHVIYTLLPVAVELTAIAIVLIQVRHPFYLIILGVAALAYVMAFAHWATVISKSAEQVSDRHIDSHAFLTDAIVNAEMVKYYDAEESMAQRYDTALASTESAWHRFFSSYAVNGLIVAAIFGCSLATSLIFAGYDVKNGLMTIGDFVLINAYVVRLAQPLELLGFAVRDVAQGLVFLSSMLAMFREQTEQGRGLSTWNESPIQGELTFENVTFRYDGERPILRNVSFTVAARRTVAIVGVSGSGKSSLIRLLFRLYDPDRGQVLIDGIPISQMNLSDLRRAIAIVPQDTVLFHDTIARNIAFGRLGADQSEIQEAARIANLHDFILRLPEGYETIVGERGLKLSGGERQRVAIARAALKRPSIFVFDEATSSLDTKTEREILRNLIDVSCHSTALVIAHRLSTVVHADEIVVLSDGAVIERGTTRDCWPLKVSTRRCGTPSKATHM